MTKEIRLLLGAKRAKVAHMIWNEIGCRGYTGPRLAKLLGCSRQNIARTINGHSHSDLVLGGLREIGVPEKYLYDPNNGVQGAGDRLQQEYREVANG